MICPTCHNNMIVVEHKKIELDYCPKCQGIWFDAGELELLLTAAGINSPQSFLEKMLSSAEVNTSEKQRKCPICRRKMKKVDIKEGGNIMVDACPSGHGIWFDGGEVGSLIKSLADKTARQAGPQQEMADFITTVIKSPG